MDLDDGGSRRPRGHTGLRGDLHLLPGDGDVELVGGGRKQLVGHPFVVAFVGVVDHVLQRDIDGGLTRRDLNGGGAQHRRGRTGADDFDGQGEGGT